MNFSTATASGQNLCAFVPQFRRCERVFPGTERRLSLLRRWLRSLIPDHRVLDDVITVATELASNAIKHTASGQDGRFAVEIICYGDVVRVAVADGGANSEPRVIDDPLAETGRGLAMVAKLAARTGVHDRRWGRVVWADVGGEIRPRILTAVNGYVPWAGPGDGDIAWPTAAGRCHGRQLVP